MRGAATLPPRPTPGVAGRATRHPRRLLLICALLSALVHAALLVNWQDGGGRSGGASSRRAVPPSPEPAGISTVRLLDGPSAPAVAVAAVEAPAAATAPDPVPETAPIAAPDATPPALPAAPDAATEAGAIARAGRDDDGTGGNGDGDDHYLSRSQLDQPPAAQAEIALPFPDTAPLGRYRAVLTLFIDPSGQVQRVRTESDSLPPSLDDAARQAFLAARFTPGMKDGQPVRSRIRVEVLYSTELLPQRSASAGATGGGSAP
ncbi:TonB family protein [Leptothrix cholodnii SP-6]|uniref:TonB family protein n=1 Tax=Leptothrix cholodnii (strain ATCC 51168 / LMG 8142 / SP-6) TaxID=395495 RepID=B1XYD0_LEPCP|nr:TonB family protein [Leptothrix cholodnii]ACB35175.1 TonB family protein [Leptothrix cholodnii SP-6]